MMFKHCTLVRKTTLLKPVGQNSFDMARENIITTESGLPLILPLSTMIRTPGKQPWQIAVSVDQRQASSQDSTDSRDCIERIASICLCISSHLIRPELS